MADAKPTVKAPKAPMPGGGATRAAAGSVAAAAAGAGKGVLAEETMAFAEKSAAAAAEAEGVPDAGAEDFAGDSEDDGDGDADEDEEGGGFLSRLLGAMVPSSAAVGDLLAAGAEDKRSSARVGVEDVRELDRVNRRRIAGKRQTVTAKLCVSSTCSNMHYSTGELCPTCQLDEAKSPATAGTGEDKLLALSKPDATPAEQKRISRMVTLEGELRALRREMVHQAEMLHVVPGEAEVADAKAAWGDGPLPANVADPQLAQLLLQFRRLDRDDDGVLSADDLLGWISLIDAEWLESCGADAAAERAAGWISASHHDGGAGAEEGRMSFPDYVAAVLRLREREMITPYQLLRNGLWDLRS